MDELIGDSDIAAFWVLSGLATIRASGLPPRNAPDEIPESCSFFSAYLEMRPKLAEPKSFWQRNANTSRFQAEWGWATIWSPFGRGLSTTEDIMLLFLSCGPGRPIWKRIEIPL